MLTKYTKFGLLGPAPIWTGHLGETGPMIRHSDWTDSHFWPFLRCGIEVSITRRFWHDQPVVVVWYGSSTGLVQLVI